jgi:hypothetical protein
MLARLAASLPKPFRALAERFDRRPIGAVDPFIDFVRTRASYIAQTSLYGYLKTRMGTQFPAFFQDATFAASIRSAAAQLFVSCLGDLTVYAVALAGADSRLTPGEAAGLARHCFRHGLAAGLAGLDDVPPLDDATERFEQRVALTDWTAAADGATSFARSESDIVRFAPVIDAYKELDREIVSNSIRFRWQDVRAQLRARVDGAP